jgi:hypothetical protein
VRATEGLSSRHERAGKCECGERRVQRLDRDERRGAEEHERDERRNEQPRTREATRQHERDERRQR